MKEIIYQHAITFIILFMLYAFFLVVIGFRQERKLRKRRKINFKRFPKYKQYFDIKTGKVYLIFCYLFIVLSAYFSFILINDLTYRIYVIVIGLLDLLILPLSILHITRSQYTKDISVYKKYHRVITSNMSNKDLLAKQIDNLERTHEKLLIECDQIKKDFQRVISNLKGIENLEETFVPLADIITLYKQQISQFESDITLKFDGALHNYLSTGRHTTLKIDQLKTIEEPVLQNILNNTTTERKKKIFTFALKQLKDKQVLSVEQLITLINQLILLDVTLTDEFIIESLNYSQEYTDVRHLLLNTLTEKKLITLDILRDYVNLKDMEWVYELPLSKLIEPEDGEDFFISLITKNASSSTFKILTSCESMFDSCIKEAAAEEQTDNETRKMLCVYSNIQTMDNQFNSKSIKYENMAVVLHHYYEDYSPSNNEATKLREIVQMQTFEENAKYIETVYQSLKEQNKNLFINTVNTLFLYSNTACTKLSFIHYDNVLNLYAEYRKNLNIKELNTLDQLLKSLILLYEQDQNKINAIFQMIETSNATYSGKLKKSEMNFENRQLVGKSNIKQLTNNRNIQTLKKVLNRIENERLSLDKIVNL